jgi:hypothetical protein
MRCIAVVSSVLLVCVVIAVQAAPIRPEEPAEVAAPPAEAAVSASHTAEAIANAGKKEDTKKENEEENEEEEGEGEGEGEDDGYDTDDYADETAEYDDYDDDDEEKAEEKAARAEGTLCLWYCAMHWAAKGEEEREQLIQTNVLSPSLCSLSLACTAHWENGYLTQRWVTKTIKKERGERGAAADSKECSLLVLFSFSSRSLLVLFPRYSPLS